MWNANNFLRGKHHEQPTPIPSPVNGVWIVRTEVTAHWTPVPPTGSFKRQMCGVEEEARQKQAEWFSPESALQAVIKRGPWSVSKWIAHPRKNILTGGAELFNRHCSLFKAERGLARGYFVSTLFLHPSLSAADFIPVPRTTLQSRRKCVPSAPILAEAPTFDK